MSNYFANFFNLDDKRFNFKLFADPTDEAFVFEDKLFLLKAMSSSKNTVPLHDKVEAEKAGPTWILHQNE